MNLQIAQGAGVGSTLVLVELYGCRSDIVNNPKKLHAIMLEIIKKHGLTPRAESLDVWDSPDSGSSTSFRTLAESHTRASAYKRLALLLRGFFGLLGSASFARAETWTEEVYGSYVNADFQVCNFSRLNKAIPMSMATELAKKLDAAYFYFKAEQRGPGCAPCTLESWRLIVRRGVGPVLQAA